MIHNGEIFLSREQVREVDLRAVALHKIPSLILMENASRSAADHLCARYGRSSSAIILCGVGNNGGDGFAVARHLYNRGWAIKVIVIGKATGFTPDAQANWKIIETMQIPREAVWDSGAVDLIHQVSEDEIVIDAMLGTGFQGELREPILTAVSCVNRRRFRSVVALDVPTGMDCDSGESCPVAIRADLTITFVAPKIGFLAPDAKALLGDVVIAEIGIPPGLVLDIAQRT